VYSYHVNATFLRLIPHSTTIGTAHEWMSSSQDSDRAFHALSPAHTAHPLLVMGVGEIIGAINLTFFIQFPLAKNFQG